MFDLKLESPKVTNFSHLCLIYLNLYSTTYIVIKDFKKRKKKKRQKNYLDKNN